MSNKLRLIKIYELRGLIHPIEQYIIDILDGIEEVSNNDYIFYKKDGRIFFCYYRNTNIHLSYQLENEFKDNFGCYIEEIREIMKYLLEKHLKIEINKVYL